MVAATPPVAVQLARADGGRLPLLAGDIGDGRDLHLEVGRGDVQAPVFLLEKDVGEDR